VRPTRRNTVPGREIRRGSARFFPGNCGNGALDTKTFRPSTECSADLSRSEDGTVDDDV
jgi:hypothetical protein